MKYTEDHEWLSLEGDIVTVGITEYAATQLGDVVFVELPEVETQIARGDEIVVIESVKAASDIVAPLDGEIVEINEALVDNPALVNDDPTGLRGSSRSRSTIPRCLMNTWMRKTTRITSASDRADGGAAPAAPLAPPPRSISQAKMTREKRCAFAPRG